MIVAFGSGADDTFMHGVDALRRRHGVSTRVVELVHLIRSGDFDVHLPEASASRIDLPEGSIRFADVTGVLCRFIDLASAAPADARERTNETLGALAELVSNLSVPVVNPPAKDLSNASKVVHQLVLNTGEGAWRVPESILSNDFDEVRAFVAAHDRRVIVKGASGHKTWVRTLTADHLSRFMSSPGLPIFLQQRIDGPDVRVHVVGDATFGEVIDSDGTDYRLRSARNKYSPIDLDGRLAARCCALAKKIGTPLVGFDFKIDACSGDWYWLEANSSPCYEGYDRRLGFAISDAIVTFLTAGS